MTDIPRIDLAAALDREWQQLASRPANVARARGWRISTGAFDDLHDLLALAGHEGHRQPASPTRANMVLRELVHAAQHDQLAGRLVLQRLLPGLLAACRRWRRGCAAAGVAPDDLLGELLADAWTSIRSYNVVRRPRNVANNLLCDTVYRAFVAPSRLMRAGEQPLGPENFATVPTDDRLPSHVEVFEVLSAARRAGVDQRHVALLCDLLRADGSAEQVARARRVSGRTIRTQRARAIARVRSATLAAA